MAAPGRAPRTDTSKTNSDWKELERKHALLREPHVAPLNAYAERLRDAGHREVPYFDPTEAGVNARILLLFKSPGRWSTGRHGSNFISPDNDDYAADKMWHFLRDARVDRAREVVSWNIVPWYVGDAQANDEVSDHDIREGRPALRELLDLLRPNPRVVVVFGRKAQTGWIESGFHNRLEWLPAPMPDPRSFGRWPEKKKELRDALVTARRIAGYTQTG